MRKLLFVPLFLSFIGAACDESDIEKVAQSLNTAIRTVEGIQSTVIAAQRAGSISKPNANAIVGMTVEVARGIGIANGVTRNFTELPEGGKIQVLEILMPVMDGIERSLDELDIIENAELKAAVELGFRTALGLMQTAQAILEVNDADNP